MYTVDASVYVSALSPVEADSAASQAFLTGIQEKKLSLFCPTLLLVEVAAAVASALGNAERAVALAAQLRSLPQILIPLDDAQANLAVGLAATTRVRGADAVYGAVAQQFGTTLVTLDRRQLERLGPIKTARPVDVLAQWETGSQASAQQP